MNVLDTGAHTPERSTMEDHLPRNVAGAFAIMLMLVLSLTVSASYSKSITDERINAYISDFVRKEASQKALLRDDFDSFSRCISRCGIHASINISVTYTGDSHIGDAIEGAPVSETDRIIADEQADHLGEGFLLLGTEDILDALYDGQGIVPLENGTLLTVSVSAPAAEIVYRDGLRI